MRREQKQGQSRTGFLLGEWFRARWSVSKKNWKTNRTATEKVVFFYTSGHQLCTLQFIWSRRFCEHRDLRHNL